MPAAFALLSVGRVDFHAEFRALTQFDLRDDEDEAEVSPERFKEGFRLGRGGYRDFGFQPRADQPGVTRLLQRLHHHAANPEQTLVPFEQTGAAPGLLVSGK